MLIGRHYLLAKSEEDKASDKLTKIELDKTFFTKIYSNFSVGHINGCYLNYHKSKVPLENQRSSFVFLNEVNKGDTYWCNQWDDWNPYVLDCVKFYM